MGSIHKVSALPYRYDSLGRQALAVSKWVNGVLDGTPEVYTQNHYDRCSMDWSRNENGSIDQPYQYVGQHGYYAHYDRAEPCADPMCLILHELVHTCGMTAHRWYGTIRIAPCGGVGFGK